MNIMQKALLCAKRKGYVADAEGNVWLNGKKVNLHFNKHGYYIFTIRDDRDKLVPIRVHQLQAYQKYNTLLFLPNTVVRHLDNNKLNNRADNICIGTMRDNIMDNPEEKRLEYAINASRHNSAFTDDQLRELKKDREAGMTYNQLIAKYNTHKGTLSYIFHESLQYKNL